MRDALRPLIIPWSIAALAFSAAFVNAAPVAAPSSAAAMPAPPAATSPAAAPPDANAQQTAAPGATVAAPLSGPQLIQLLDQTIDWYRTLGIQQQTANEPSDQLILNDNRQAASRVMSLAIEFARADADILAKQPAAAGTNSVPTSLPLTQLQNKFNAQSVQVQAELAAAQRELPTARGNAAVELKAKISELQGELDLLASRKELLSTMLTITSDSDANGSGASSLKAQIDAMAITVPSSNNPAPPASAPAAATPSTGNTSAAPSPLAAAASSVMTRFGIWDLASNAFRLSEKIVTIDGVDSHTAALQTAFAHIRDPLVDQVRGLSSRGDALADQADSANAATLTQIRAQLDSLAGQIKQQSALLIPLGKEGVLLTQYRRNLANWRSIIHGQYDRALRMLGVRLLILAALLAVVFAAAEFWRRAVMHYIRDTRRRYQLLLLRKISLWTLTVVIIGFAFSSELGSVVTFAGLITAGLAVAMQSVLVSIVG